MELNMSPFPSSPYQSDHRATYAKFFGQINLCSCPGSDLQNLRGRQLTSPMSFATGRSFWVTTQAMILAASHSPLVDSIVHVVNMIPNKQMEWADTWGIVATMERPKWAGVRPGDNKNHNAACSIVQTANRKDAISPRRSPSAPKPTPISVENGDVLPKLSEAFWINWRDWSKLFSRHQATSSVFCSEPFGVFAHPCGSSYFTPSRVN